MSNNKKYGLIIPSEKGSYQKPVFKSAQNVFGSESESDEEAKKPVLLRPSHTINRQAKLAQEKAVLEDPTVYQYDEIYDSMANKKEEKKVKVKEEKKPRYIENLLKAADKRKLENERRLERQVQKEREKEGDEFADKEVFVTSAYKKKIEEMKLEEEKEKREEYLESIGDVTKQRDLGGFYRHLYEQKMGKEVDNKEENNKKQENVPSNSSGDVKTKDSKLSQDKNIQLKISSKNRSYRKRKSSHDDPKSLSEGEIDDSDGNVDEEINRVNLVDIKAAKKKKMEENVDADSDFLIDSSSEEDTDKKKKTDTISPIKKSSVSDEPDPLNKPVTPKNNTEGKLDVTEQKDNVTSKAAEREPSPPPKPKVDIWKKRTVGDLFDQALLRYYQRKAARSC